ncbi:MAG: HigA family addiction module antidote protein [Bacteroidales bacterium]|nr:HigA family addiction module antidote protein [Bacteroidales bacterium]
MSVKVGDMEFYTLNEVDDQLFGKRGTPEREEFIRECEKEIKEAKKRFSCPGEYIREGIKQVGLKQKDFAVKMNMTPSNVTELLQSKRRITPLIAKRLEDVLYYPVDYWLNLQNEYDTEKKLKQKESVVLTVDWAEKMLQTMNELKNQIDVLISLQQQNHKTPATR